MVGGRKIDQDVTRGAIPQAVRRPWWWRRSVLQSHPSLWPVMNIYTAIKGTPSARRAAQPGQAPGMAQGSPTRSVGQTGVPPWADGLAGESRRWGRRPGPAALALGTHGAGRRRSAVTPHPPPGGPDRHAPGHRARPSGRTVLHAPGDLVAVKAPSQGHSGRWPPRPLLRRRRPLTASFPSEVRALARRTGG